MVIPYLFLPIGFLLLALQYLSNVTRILRKSPASPAAPASSEKQPEVEQQI
jgi:TRAP-type C4-dicarboxylate transport system permease small subunit